MKTVIDLLRFLEPTYAGSVSVLKDFGVPKANDFFQKPAPIDMPPQLEPVGDPEYVPIQPQYQYRSNLCYYYAAMHIIFSAYSRKSFNIKIDTPDFETYFNDVLPFYYAIKHTIGKELDNVLAGEGGYDFIAILAIALKLKINTFYYTFHEGMMQKEYIKSFDKENPIFIGIIKLDSYLQTKLIFENIEKIMQHINVIGFLLGLSNHAISLVKKDDFEFMIYDSSAIEENELNLWQSKKYTYTYKLREERFPHEKFSRATLILGDEYRKIQEFIKYLEELMIANVDDNMLNNFVDTGLF